MDIEGLWDIVVIIFNNLAEFFFSFLLFLVRIFYGPPAFPPGKVRHEKILFRHKQQLMTPLREHFLTVHSSFSSVLTLTRSDVLLLEITESEVIFIRVPPTQKTSKIHPFYYEAQFETGIELIFAPHSLLFEAAKLMEEREKEREGETKEPHLILLTSTGRCGSTLFTQVLESQGKEGEMLCLSEPDWMIQLNKPSFTKEFRAELLKACVRVTLKKEGFGAAGGEGEPLPPPAPSVLVLKPRSQFCGEVELWQDNFPDSDVIFLYRHCETFINSWSALAHGSPPFRRLVKDVMFKLSTGTFLHKKIKEMFETTMLPSSPVWKQKFDEGVREEFYSTFYAEIFFGLVWLKSIEGYVQMREKEKEGKMIVLPVSFDDFLKRKTEAIQEVLSFCNLSDLDLEKAEAVLSKDSQKGTVISATLNKTKNQKFSCQSLSTWPTSLITIKKMAEIHPEIGSLDVVFPVSEAARTKIEKNQSKFS